MVIGWFYGCQVKEQEYQLRNCIHPCIYYGGSDNTWLSSFDPTWSRKLLQKTSTTWISGFKPFELSPTLTPSFHAMISRHSVCLMYPKYRCRTSKTIVPLNVDTFFRLACKSRAFVSLCIYKPLYNTHAKSLNVALLKMGTRCPTLTLLVTVGFLFWLPVRCGGLGVHLDTSAPAKDTWDILGRRGRMAH